MTNRNYRGLVAVAPAQLNPKQQPDRYAFSGSAVPTGDAFVYSFRVVPLSGCVSPQQFAEDVTAQDPLPGDLELYAPVFDLGKFSYFRPSTGKLESAKADDVTGHKPDELHAELQPVPAPALLEPASPDEPEEMPLEPESPTPGGEF